MRRFSLFDHPLAWVAADYRLNLHSGYPFRVKSMRYIVRIIELALLVF
jgi:hypothetical protein